MVGLIVALAIVAAIVGVPLGVALYFGIIPGVLFFAPAQETTVARLFVDNVNDPNIVAITLLVIAGELMTAANIIEPIMQLFELLLGRIRGGMALACVFTGLILAGATGSSAAEAAALASALQKPLGDRGYDPAFTGALIAATGALGVLFPPSVALIIFGTIIEYPVGKLWLAGIVPGLIGALFIAIVAVAIGRRYETPAATFKAGERPKVNWWRTLPAALIPVVVIGGIRTGLLTVSETASILVTYVVIYGFASRRLNLAKLVSAFQRGGRRCAMIFLILIAARTFTFFVIQRELAPALLSWATAAPIAHWMLLALLNVFLLVLGTMMDGLSLLIIATPLIYPVVTQLGMSPLQLAIMLGVNIEVAVVHPPFGMNLFAVAGVTGTSVMRISLRVLPFIGVLLALLVLVTYAPLPIFLWNQH